MDYIAGLMILAGAFGIALIIMCIMDKVAK